MVNLSHFMFVIFLFFFVEKMEHLFEKQNKTKKNEQKRKKERMLSS